MIDPPERRRPEARFGGLRQLKGIRGVGTRDWAARESLCGERGCEGELVAREGRDGRGVGGAEAVPEGARRREMCLGTGDQSETFSYRFEVG